MKLCCVALPNSKYSTKYTKYTENIESIWSYNRDKVPLFNLHLNLLYLLYNKYGTDIFNIKLGPIIVIQESESHLKTLSILYWHSNSSPHYFFLSKCQNWKLISYLSGISQRASFTFTFAICEFKIYLWDLFLW